MDSGRVSSSCSTSDTRRFTLVTKPVISHEWGKDRIVITTNGTYPGSFGYSVTHNVRSHDMIFNPIFPFDSLSTKIVFCEHKSKMSRVEWKRRLKISWKSDENLIVRTVNDFKNRIKIEWKFRQCEHMFIGLTCAAIANSLGNRKENRIVWRKTMVDDFLL
jgi:hypothetical protein